MGEAINEAIQECPKCKKQINTIVGRLCWCSECQMDMKPLTPEKDAVSNFLCSDGLCLLLRELKEEVKEHVRSSELDDEEELCLVGQELIVGRIDTFFEDKIYDIEKKA